MGNERTVAERLRENKGYSGTECFFAEVAGRRHLCNNYNRCKHCAEDAISALADQIEAEQAERTKTEQNGVDVDALLKLADTLENTTQGRKEFGYMSAEFQVVLDWVDSIRDAVKGANPSKSTGLIPSKSRELPEGIEWPRFTDGELVKFGDEAAWGVVSHITFGHEGCTAFSNMGIDELFAVSYGIPVKRPEPEVLDADGVPIKVGDTVWFKGEKFVVSHVYSFKEGSGVNLESSEKDEFGFAIYGIANAEPEFCTHRKPDTQDFAFNDTIGGVCAKVGTFDCYAPMLTYPDRKLISVDRCLIPEITHLHLHGIKTVGCCCGHPKDEERGGNGFIQVDPACVDAMLNLGYEQLPTIPIDDNSEHDMGQWCFKPKSKLMGGEQS